MTRRKGQGNRAIGRGTILRIYAFLVLLVSIAPGLLFLVLVLRMDRREPEPLGLVLRVLALGALASLPALLVEFALSPLPIFHLQGLRGAALVSFLQVAPVEEAAKLAVVLLLIWRNRNFNEENDGIVYVGASALGFGLLENVVCVARQGLGVGLLRAFSAIPVHVFTGIVLGYSVGLARFAPSDAGRRRLLVRGFLTAWLLHGTYDTLVLSGSVAALLALPLVVVIVVIGIAVLRRGRELSVFRWSPLAGSGESSEDAAEPARAPLWMAVVARALLIACLLFWGLLFLGLSASEEEWRRGEAVLGGMFLTFIPVFAGLLLEISYRRRRKRAASGARGVFEQASPAPPRLRSFMERAVFIGQSRLILRGVLRRSLFGHQCPADPIIGRSIIPTRCGRLETPYAKRRTSSGRFSSRRSGAQASISSRVANPPRSATV
ncbi:MAG: PrsW family intramembrane metalloprotease [Candidatus Eisenbacteria bacterium]